jgi:hypothetical protein
MPNDIVIHVLAETKKAIDGLRQTQEEIRQLSEQTRTFTGLSAAFSGWTAVIGVVQSAFSHLTQFISSCTEAARENIDAAKRLQASLMISGRYSAEAAKQFSKFADSLSAVTDYSGAEITRVVAHFVRLRLADNIVQQATKATLDLAAAMGMDLQSAAVAVGKALVDPEHGLTALRRQGTLVTAQQQEFIRSLMASRREMEAQAEVLKLLSEQYGDFAAQTSSAVKRMENAWTELKASLGAYVTDFQNAFATTMLPILQQYQNKLERLREMHPGALSPTEKIGVFMGRAFGEAAQSFLSDPLRFFADLWEKSRLFVTPFVTLREDVRGAELDRQLQAFWRDRQQRMQAQQAESEAQRQLTLEAEEYLQKLREENRLLGLSAEYRKLAELQAKGLSDELAAQIQQQIQLNEARKAQLKVEEKLAALRQETQAAQVTEAQRRLLELQQAGATAAQLEEARQLLAVQEQIRKQQEAQKQAQEEHNRMVKEAETIRRAIMTEEQRIMEQANQAGKLLQAGLITPQEYLAYLEKLKATIKPPEDLARQVRQQTQLAAALRFGTTEAYSAIVRAAMMAIRPPAGGPQEQVARNTQQIVERLDRLIAAVKQQEAI